jgi:hypothetical protein
MSFLNTLFGGIPAAPEAAWFTVEMLEERRLLSAGPAVPILNAEPLDEYTIRLTYSVDDGSRLQLERLDPRGAIKGSPEILSVLRLLAPAALTRSLF